MGRPTAILAVLLCLAGCDPYAAWPDDGSYFPYEYTPESDLEAYEEVRFETETWDPVDDLDMAGLYLLKSVNHRPGAPAGRAGRALRPRPRRSAV